MTVQAETVSGRVISVADGDTLTLLDAHHVQHKIRLSGIDAPEKRQDFGFRAKSSLAAMAAGRLAVADCRKQDRYRRSICVVRVDGKDVGFEQIRQGMAWWYRQYAKDQSSQERVAYERAEAHASEQRIGLWREKQPTPPWEWRRIPR